MAWLTAQSRSGWRWVGVGLALLAALLAIALRSGSAAGAAGDCEPNCVILIQVDGLEPKDVTPQATPYLWALAHPTLQGQGPPGGALAARSGWIWQAPRGVVSTGTAPATASLLTGAFAERTGIPADDFYGPTSNNDPTMHHQRLTAGGFGDTPDPGAGDDVAGPIASPAVETVLDVVAKNDQKFAVFLGDPGLATVSEAKSDDNLYWYPPGDEDTKSATDPEGQYTGDPRLCPAPRYPDGGTTGPPPDETQASYDPRRCPANDMTTMNKAISDLNKTENSGITFTFAHLAELGAVKRSSGDPQDVTQALAATDAAVATFAEQYANTHGDKWAKTVLMVVGAHGYQPTPVANRVPDPDAVEDPTRDLSDYVAKFSVPGVAEEGSLRLAPQGTFATVYYDLAGQKTAVERANALAEIKKALEEEVNPACQTRNQALPGDPPLPPCIENVYYTDSDAPTGSVANTRKTWRLDTRDSKGVRTRAGGDLVVELGRGWAVGRAVGVPYQGTSGLGKPFTNAQTASAGGPQERAVAALINGPAQQVRNLDTFMGASPSDQQTPRYPIGVQDDDPAGKTEPPLADEQDEQACPDKTDTETPADPGGLQCANDPAKVVDDANDPGHKWQPETVDFAITISALMQLQFESSDQLHGRPLQEAFLSTLKVPEPQKDPPPDPTCGEVAELTQAGTPVTVTLSCSDVEGTPLTYRIVSGPEHGTVGPVAGDTVTYTPAAGYTGVDSFTYVASTTDGRTSDVATAFVTVMEPPMVVQGPTFNFHGLIQQLKALVVDARGNTYARARRGTMMSTIRLEADFGKPETAVTLTFYRQAPKRRGAPRSRVVRLKPIARFDPFVVKRGHVIMRLTVPVLFRPTYVGVHVREVAQTPSGRRQRSGAEPCTRLRTRKPVPFRCIGPTRGVIARIADAGRLHKRKGGGRPRTRRR